MSDFKLRIVIGDTQIELEGSDELVHTIFSELREQGLGELSSFSQKNTFSNASSENNHKIEETNLQMGIEGDNSKIEETELPSLSNVVLQGNPQQENEWLLVYALYSSDFGKRLFSRNHLKEKYTESKRVTPARSKNFNTNLKSLVGSGYISAVNDQDFRIEKSGIDQAKMIILGTSRTERPKPTTSSTKKKTASSYEIVDLGLSEKQRDSFREFWKSHDHSKHFDKAVLVTHWLNKEASISEVTANHLLTMLRVVEESASFELGAAFRNAKMQGNYIVNGDSKKSYKINHFGEDHVKKLEIPSVNS